MNFHNLSSHSQFIIQMAPLCPHISYRWRHFSCCLNQMVQPAASVQVLSTCRNSGNSRRPSLTWQISFRLVLPEPLAGIAVVYLANCPSKCVCHQNSQNLTKSVYGQTRAVILKWTGFFWRGFKSQPKWFYGYHTLYWGMFNYFQLLVFSED